MSLGAVGALSLCVCGGGGWVGGASQMSFLVAWILEMMRRRLTWGRGEVNVPVIGFVLLS